VFASNTGLENRREGCVVAIFDGFTDIFNELFDHVVKVFVWVDLLELEHTIGAVL
jgi:hypothetical protein